MKGAGFSITVSSSVGLLRSISRKLVTLNKNKEFLKKKQPVRWKAIKDSALELEKK
ncbi:unnamed protein product, partial [Dovyalis caffra]